MTWWSPKPLRELNLHGIFSHDEGEAAKIEKSAPPNRWVQQRELDGSPHTRHGASVLMPPPAGPQLYVADVVDKSIAADMGPPKVKREAADDVVKAYLGLAKAQKAPLKAQVQTKSSLASAVSGGVSKISDAAIGTMRKLTPGAKSLSGDARDEDEDGRPDGGVKKIAVPGR